MTSITHWRVGERTRCGLDASKVECVDDSAGATCYRCADGVRADRRHAWFLSLTDNRPLSMAEAKADPQGVLAL